MRKHLLSIAAACVLAAPTMATTFPSLTTIYVVTGIKDNGGTSSVGTATAIQCSNVSGVTTTIRFLTLSATGVVLDSTTADDVAHGATIEVSTHNTNAYTNETASLIAGIVLSSGVLNIESLQSGVFCTAAIIDASLSNPVGITPHIIRINPHPGSVE
jgi:hypothetical protein